MRLKRNVALKFLSPQLTLDEAAKQWFIQKAQAAYVRGRWHAAPLSLVV